MKKRLFILLIIAILSAGLLSGCGENQEAKKDNMLVYGSGDYTAINPALYEHGEINALIFAGLTAHDEENKVVPGLAEKWSFDEDSMTWTFKLREGLTFHDGEPLTSEDVKFTLEAILDPDNASEIVSNYSDIDYIDCPDDQTVNIKLKRINVAFPDYMTIGILPAHLLEGQDITTCDFNRNPIGAGPYKIAEWDLGQAITMERFDNYYGGMPKIETVIFKIVPDTDARTMQLESGDLDMAQITPKNAETLQKNENYNVFEMKTADYRALAYNFNNPFFKEHPELPGILSYGIDREAIVKSVLLGQGEAAYSPLQTGPYNYENMKKYSYNPEKCQIMLEEEGWQKGTDGIYEKNGEKLKFSIAAMSDDKVRVDMATMCAAQLKAIGIDVTAETRPSLDWEGQTGCIIGWGSPFDPDDHTYKVFTTGAGDNYTGYSDQKVDQILLKARSTDNTTERVKLYKEFQQQIAENLPYTFIAYVNADYAIAKNISGICESTVLGHHGVGVFWNISEWEIK